MNISVTNLIFSFIYFMRFYHFFLISDFLMQLNQKSSLSKHRNEKFEEEVRKKAKTAKIRIFVPFFEKMRKERKKTGCRKVFPRRCHRRVAVTIGRQRIDTFHSAATCQFFFISSFFKFSFWLTNLPAILGSIG